MDKLIEIRKKYSMSSEEELNQSFTTGFHHMKESLKKQEDHLFESQLKLQQLKSEVDEIENSVSSEKELLNSKVQELSVAEERMNELKTDRDTLLREVRELEIKRNSMRNSKPNAKDQKILESGMQKLNYYKQLTGIRWDFSAPKELAKGYVTNGMDYIHSFNYNKTKHGQNLVELLWEEIGKAAEGTPSPQGIKEEEVLDE